METTQTYRLRLSQRFLVLFVSLILFTAVGMLLMGIINGKLNDTAALRVSTVIQDCFVFILPALTTACLVSSLPANFLSVNKGFSFSQLLLALLGILASMPAMNLIVKLNEQLILPKSLLTLELWMIEAEAKAQESVEILLGQPTIASLIINLLIVAFLAGFSEEIFFRGALLGLFRSGKMNIHAAIWLSALVFSAFHLQFYGFIPRLLLGAYFGYLLYWSKSSWLPVLAHTFNNAIVVSAKWGTQIKGEKAMESINNFGEGSWTLILASVILTVFILRYLYRYHKLGKY